MVLQQVTLSLSHHFFLPAQRPDFTTPAHAGKNRILRTRDGLHATESHGIVVRSTHWCSLSELLGQPERRGEPTAGSTGYFRDAELGGK